MAYHVYSTLTASQKFPAWKQGGADLKVYDKFVCVKGGANLTDKNFVTPQGVVTSLTDDEYEMVKDNATFNKFVDRGFFKVTKKKVSDISKAVSDLNARDKSAPLTDGDFEKDKAPKLNVVNG
jgi:hypothetical protein